MIEKAHSASPYVLIPHRLIETMIARKTVTLNHLGTGEFQYSRVIEAAITSSGIVTNH